MSLQVKTMGYRGSMASNAVLSFPLAFLAALLIGCGSGSSSGVSTAPEGSPLSITTQPASQTIPLSQAATFTVVAGGGIAPYKYQWTKDGAPLG